MKLGWKLSVVIVALAATTVGNAQTVRFAAGLAHVLKLKFPKPYLREEEKEGEFEHAFNDFYMRRIDSRGRADWTAYGRAAKQARSLGNPRAQFPRIIGNWGEIGPKFLDVPYKQYYGPKRATTGRVTAVAWDPMDIKTYYLASSGGGVLKTTDDGANWTPLSDTATWPHMQVGAIAVDPRDRNKVYAGLGDARGNLRFYGAGIMESGDAGQTWTLNAATAGTSVSEMVVDPSNGNVLVTTGNAVYYDRYTGTWRAGVGNVYVKKPGGNYEAAVGLPANTVWVGCSIGAKGRDLKRNYVVAGIQLDGMGGGELQVWMGKDGTNWVNLNVPSAALAALGTGSGIDASASPANANNVYVVNGNSQRVYRYDIAAGTWHNITAATFPSDLTPGDNYNWSQAWYDIHIMCSYTPGGNRDVLYCGLITLAASDDQGTTWKDVGMTYTPTPNTHNDQHCAAYFPGDPRWVLFGNDGGIYAIQYDQTLRDWSGVFNTVNNANIAQFYHGDVAMDRRENAIGGTQDNASPRSFGADSPNDGLAATMARWNNAGGGDGGWTAVDTLDSNISYTAVTGTLWHSDDGWASAATGSTANVFPVLPPYWPDGAMGSLITYDRESFVGAGSLHHNSTTLYYATEKYLFRYTKGTAQDPNFSRFDSSASGAPGNDGRLRYRLGPDAPLYQNSGLDFTRTAVGFITAVVTAPSDPATVYVGTSDGFVWVTRNATAAKVTDVSWVRVDRNLPLRSINEIVVHPFDSEKVWCVLGGTGDTKDYVWHCSDTRTLFGAVPWKNLDAQGLFPVCHNTIALDPKSPASTLYVGTDCGVKTSTDAGATWSSITTNKLLPNVQVNKLVPSGCTTSLTAFTFGRGVWQVGVENAAIQGFGFGPATIKGGTGSTLRVVLWEPAIPIFGATIALSPPNPYFAFPPTVHIAPGDIEVTVPIATAAVAANTVVSLTASYAGESRVTSITLTP